VRYRTKPVGVEAVQWTGENRREVEAIDPDHVAYYRLTNSFLIDAVSGCEQVGVGCYIVKREDGGLCKYANADFYATFEPASPDTDAEARDPA
jgi:hypothetical protein